jgi:hypothetical protein
MPISPAEYQRRLKTVTQGWLEKTMIDMVTGDDGLKELKRDELEMGLRPNGQIIGLYRFTEYEIMKYRMNPKARGKVDLILTGSFVGGMYAIYRGSRKFLFNSKDKKKGQLVGKYGDDIMGLNQSKFDKRQKELYAPVLIFQIKRYAKIR